MKVACIGNGDGEVHLIAEHFYDFIVVLDGGVHACINAGITPSVVIGDMDSAPSRDLFPLDWEDVDVVKIEEQDTSDLQKGIGWIHTQWKSADIDLYAVSGDSRMDHSLSAVHMLRHHEWVTRIITETETVEYVVAEAERIFSNAQGKRLSVVPVSETAVVSVSGCQWDEQSVRLGAMRSGISNTVQEEVATLTIEEGSVYVIRER